VDTDSSHHRLSLVERIAHRQDEARARADALRTRVPMLASRLRALGATRVRLFGSLATHAEPHAATDIDLCVEGLDDSAAGDARLDLEPLAGTRVDVVCWESASECLRARIVRDGVEVVDEPR
jgi:predicted nucleotidyltransferase